MNARISMHVPPKHPAPRTLRVVKCVWDFVEGSESFRDDHFATLINA